MKDIFYKIHSYSFGDTLSSTPTLRYLSKSHQSKINVVTHNKQVFNKNPYINNLLSFEEYDQIKNDDDLIYESFTYAGTTDKNDIEKKFSHIDHRQIHAMDLGFQLLPEDMSYDYFPEPLLLNLDLPEKYVVLHITSNWPNRTWNIKYWEKLIDWLSKNKIFTVLIGSGYTEILHNSYSDRPLEKVCPKFENLYGVDLTNQGSMSDMWWVINESLCLITMDSGPLHLAGCTDTNIIQLGSAINPKLRAPYRNGSQEYKYNFIGGGCEIFCNSNLLYNVKVWGDINHVPPQPHCLEDKPTFECHPTTESVIQILNNILFNGESKSYRNFFELIHTDDDTKLYFNFKYTSDDIVKIVVRDIETGLVRDTFTNRCERLNDTCYWWVPNPGRLNNIGNIDLMFYLNDIHHGNLRINFPSENHLTLNENKMILKKIKEYFVNLDDEIYSVFWEIFLNDEYNKEENCSINKNDVVLDIGGNYGLFALYSLSKGASKVYSVEPVKNGFDSITKLSKQLPIVPINKAITTNGDLVQMTLDEKTPAKNCLTSHNDIFSNEGETIWVESYTINELIGKINDKINLVKIDCEGCEGDIFTTINDSVLKEINRIIIETHNPETEKMIFNKLIDNYFKVYQHNNILFAVNEN
jgi:FkbM family methyltransferase